MAKTFPGLWWEARRLVPLSLFATARRHWTWLRGAIERLCQFSREARLHRAKKNEGSCTPSLGCYSAHWPVTHSSGCMVRVWAAPIPVLIRITWVCNPATVKAAEELHARSKGYSTLVRIRRSPGWRADSKLPWYGVMAAGDLKLT